MRRILALSVALCLALGLTGRGQAASASETGDQAAAVDAWSQAIAADQDRADAYMGRAKAYLALAETEQDQPGPDLAALARQDFARALALDPDLGDEIYEIYAALADAALAGGDTDRAMLDMQAAMAAAPDEADAFQDQAKAITDQLLPGSVWYMDAPDSRYFELFAGGSGRVLDGVNMQPAGTLEWENGGFDLTLTLDGESVQWSYAPDKASYYTTVSSPEGDELALRVGRASLRDMYARWQADILAQRAEDLRDDTPEDEKAAVYGELCDREQALLDALADSLATDAAAPEMEDGTGAQEIFDALRQTVNRLLVKLPKDESAAASALGELFPIGDEALLDYLRLAVDWSLRAGELTVPENSPSPAAWESLEDVDHYFEGGRLYLLLDGYTRERDDALTPESHGLYPLQTPLTCWDDCTVEGPALLARLRDSRWLGLWQQENGTFFLDLTLAKSGNCSAVGGHYPGPVMGSQRGGYALDGRELTLDLAAEGYLPGTYRYEIYLMGESLYCTLLTDGIVYGQTAGSRYLFCGGGFARDARTGIG